ncbi:protein dachsous-like [Babylonia areolata]|uniref:protein dachsous-like n=1 Tax=Babylonia areolata TaxID=304850 RepID=UPI003FD65A8C
MMLWKTEWQKKRWPSPWIQDSVAVLFMLLAVRQAGAESGGLVCDNEKCTQTFSVAENASIGTYVGTARNPENSMGFNDFIPVDYIHDSTQVFRVELSTGRITTKALLDRETVPNGEYSFVLQTNNSDILLLVRVKLLDINDNSPSFSPTFKALNFSESAPFGATKSLGSVTDPDQGTNSTVTCEIVSGNLGNVFLLSKKISGEHVKILDLKVNGRLDFEDNPIYNLVIRATDGGGRTGEMTVKIVILDQNDNQPIFNTSKYEVTVAENATVDTSIIQVQATDQDSGANGRIRYSISRETDPDLHFRIDPVTGVVRVNKPLDYETQSTFRLTLEATDDGPNRLVGNAALDVNLQNINEQPANIRVVYLQGADRQGHIPENTKAGTPVARISIDDPDISVDRQDDVNVALFGGDDVFGLQVTDGVLSLVVVNTPPDRENKSSYDLTVVVTDSGSPPLRATKLLTIVIDDVNDNAPQFTKNPYEAEVQETAEVGTSVVRVTAEDADEGDNARVVYSILGSSSPQAGWFSIDSRTGVITTRTPIDCELNPQPVLVVVARDQGEPPLSGSTSVRVSVRDVNDKQPEFDTSFYSARVAEDAAVGHCPVKVHATDPECGASTRVRYQLAPNGGAPEEFEIGENSGEVCIRTPGLDFETTSSYQFLVRAVDRDGLSASAVVQILVTDVNDNSPSFHPLTYTLSVEAGVSPGPLLTVQGVDLDSGDFGTVTYTFLNDNGNQFFRIDGGSGTISLVKAFPPDTQRVFQLQVQGTDKGGRVSDVPARVQISVYSGDVHPPVFTLTMYNFTVAEDVPVGTLVGEVEATVQSSSSSSSSAEIRYSIDYSSEAWFRVAADSGQIFTTATLDRETQPFVLLSVSAQVTVPQNLSSTAQVNLTLLDVNDNSPYFPPSSVLHIEVREDAVLQYPVYIAHAVDRDAGPNGSVLYRLHNHRPSDGLFDIDQVTGEVYVRAEMDYERHHHYEVVIVAEDQGTSGRQSSSMTLTVSVKDVNDNYPVFVQSVYDFYVSEDRPIGFEFGNVTATDADSEHNGRVSYSLEASPYLSVFGIFTVQGVLTLRDNVDRESQDLYTLTVMATDHGTPQPLSTTATVRIHITDTNDNDPEFSRSEYKFSILENQPPGSLIGQITASDRDTGDNQRLRFHFGGSGQVQANFSVDADSGEISTLVSLDREEQDEYRLRVYVTDSGQPSRSDTAVLRVSVMDVNDNRPRFLVDGEERRVEVGENRPKGLHVFRVTAVDRDAGENGTVSFELDPVHSDPEAVDNFSIHPSTGWISTEEVLDYETKSQYTLRVLAHDNGYPRQSQAIDIVIAVRDDNEEGPLFHAREIQLNVVENLPIGTSIGRVQDEVRESADSRNIHFLLVGGNVFDLFAVDRSTGVIQTVREVDYEQSSSHTLSIQAVDLHAAFPRSSNISVIIQVQDVNDNVPVFDSDPVFLRTLRENTPVNHVVHTFIATDDDSGPNGTVRYTILSQSASGPQPLAQGGDYFLIHPTTGELSLSTPIDYEHVHTVTLVVQAEDDCPVASLALASQVTAVVFLQDVNDNRPEFQSPSEMHVLENEAVGYPVVLVVAVDGDSNQADSGNNVVRYSIVSGNEDGKFRLDQTTGLLTIYEALDRETRAGYVLNVSAEDSGVPRMAAYQELRVFVEDVNDNAPLFGLSVYQGSVNESSPSGSHVLTVMATDSDQGPNGNVTYSIPVGIAGDKFAVNALTGEITTREILDREEQDVYSITVYATDSGLPALQDLATVVVRVSDVNDHDPAFEEAVYQVRVPENHPQRDLITLIAADLDVGANADVTYTISGSSDDRFQIDPRTGQLSCRALDRETHPHYTLTVTATDSGTPRRSGTAQVTVKVMDLNDNSPQFSQAVYSTAVREDVAQGVTVMRVSASDPDEGSNGVVTYSLLGNDTEGFFSVNSSSGDIITSGVFDREKNSSFEFLLVATDGGGSGPRNSTARIRISIADVNDNAPKFRQVPYKVTVSPNTTPGHTVLQMRADDPDMGDNGTVSYRLLEDGGGADPLFAIHPSTGTLTTRTSLSQATGYHSLLVLATDRGSPALSTTGVAEIIVGDNSSVVTPLRFQQEVYVADIVENAANNTDITTVRASYTESGDVTYSFVSGNELSTFRIDSNSGLIRVADPAHLDYESTPHLKLVVAAAAGGHQAYATVQVRLRDLNDNAPKFAQTKYVASVWENNQPQTFVTQVWAKDEDSGINGTIAYKIIFGDDYNIFEVFPTDSGIVRTNIDAPRLDREILRSHITLTIEAQDMGYPPQRSICRLHITFVDENDNAPTFPIPGPGPVYLAENVRAGHVVAVVTATDVDLNPVLVYNFTAQGNPENRFTIDRSSGTVRLASTLDRETRSHYTLGLQVTDGLDTASTTLEVFVTDVNDNPPRFLRSHYLTSLPENAPPSTSVLRVTAQDADAGSNADVTYSLLGAGAAAGFAVDPKNGTIFTTKSLQTVAPRSMVQLVVAARDGGSPSLSSVATVQIHLTRINTHTPAFLRTNYSVSVKESLQRGTEILTVSALDSDNNDDDDDDDSPTYPQHQQGNDHHLHYVLSGPSASTFHIQPATGRIVLNGDLDHERMSRYDLLVMAVDRGTPPRNATVPVTITVTDVNDNPPRFHSPTYFVSLEETHPVGQVFLRVNATDEDEGPHAELEYALSSGNGSGSGGAFACSKKGELLLLSPLDFESRAWHRLVVRAVDCVRCPPGAPRLSAYVTVVVNVTDVNEFAPQFPVPHYFGSVSENLEAYLTVFQVHANDPDGGEYGQVTYTILPQHDKDLFGVDLEKGHIVTKKTFNFEDPEERKVYNITIRATDAGGLHSTVPVTITVTDEDEFPPKFTNQSYSFRVPGSAKKGAHVGTVSARDADGGSAGRVVFTLERPVAYFRIDPVSGNISVAHTLHEDVKGAGQDRRRRRRKRALVQDSETLIVRGSSGMEGSLSSTVVCLISIDRSCAGCQAPLHELEDGLSDVAIALIVIVCILVPTIIVVVLLVFICQKRRTKGVPTSVNGEGYGGREGTLSVTPPPLEEAGPLPTFKSALQYNNHIRAAKVNVSDFSEQSHNSASSGRGSVEVEEEDDLRRVANSGYLTNLAAFRHKTMPDSGIQQDDDTLQEPAAATNHQEYLARLGIDSSKIGKLPPAKHSAKGSSSGSTSGVDMTFCVENVPRFGDVGGGGGGEGGGGVDIDHFTDTDVDEEMVMIENSRRLYQQQQHQGVSIVPAGGGASFQAPEPQQTGALSHVVNNEEEYSGSYNWDYLLDWGPQYQPLAHVFSEIAKLKDESVPPPKKTPVKTVPQRKINGGQGLAVPQARILPPPIITSAPPPLGLLESSDCDDSDRVSEGPRGSRGDRSHKSSSSSASGGTGGGGGGGAGSRSQRAPKAGPNQPPHLQPSLPSLPRSPISYEPSLSSSALTPSFTPSVSPLGTHTPSFSPSSSATTANAAVGGGGGGALQPSPRVHHHHHHHAPPVSGRHPHHHTQHLPHPPPPPPAAVHHAQPHHHHHHHHQPHPHPPAPHHRGQYNGNSAKASASRGHWTHSPSSESDREFRI